MAILFEKQSTQNMQVICVHPPSILKVLEIQPVVAENSRGQDRDGRMDEEMKFFREYKNGKLSSVKEICYSRTMF